MLVPQGLSPCVQAVVDAANLTEVVLKSSAFTVFIPEDSVRTYPCALETLCAPPTP